MHMTIRQPVILLFGFDQIRAFQVAQVAGQEQLPCRSIGDGRYEEMLGALAGAENWQNAMLAMPPVSAREIPEGIMIICGVPGPVMERLLQRLKKALPFRFLKAVLTEHNANWNILQLYEHLCAERSALNAGRS